MEAQTGMMQPGLKECSQSPEAGQGMGQILPQSLQRERDLQHPDLGSVILISDFWLPELRENTFLLL